MNQPTDASPKMAWLGEQLANAQQMILELQKDNKELRKENAQLREENEKLHRELHQYKNENRPSGSIPPYLKKSLAKLVEQPKEEQKKTPAENPRNERTGKIDKTEKHILLECPHCHGELSEKKRKQYRTIIHLKAPETESVRHECSAYWCKTCKKEVVAKVSNALPNSKFDLQTAILTSYFFVDSNNSMGTIKSVFSDVFGLKISKATISNTFARLKDYLGEEYKELEERIRKAKARNKDETSFRKNGKTLWAWVCATTEDVLYRIDKRRNITAARKLPCSEDSTDGCDGYRAYDHTEGRKQRCWSHGLRKAKTPEYGFRDEREIGAYKQLVAGLGEIYHDAKEDKKKLGVSVELKKAYEKKLLDHLQSIKWLGKNTDKVMNYYMAYFDDWFTFLEFEGVEPTNNSAEQALRHLVLKRRVSQQFRSTAGMESYAVQLSLRTSAKLKGQNYLDYLEHVIGNQISGVGKY